MERPSTLPTNRTLSRLTRSRLTLSTGVVVLLGSAAACGDDPTNIAGESQELLCSIPAESILSGQRKDGIPALTNPELASPGQPGTEYLLEEDRVIGVMIDGEPIAVPLNIMWWHEVVNFDAADGAIAVTHCPLTGSSLSFLRGPVADAEFGVSGLLFQTNLIMYDRSGSQESLWPQMLRGARCGPRDGTPLPMVPSVEMTWAGWQRLHPYTKVVTSNTGRDRDYRSYPYGSYDQPTNANLLFPIGQTMDPRRPPKERVLGVPDDTGGLVFPYGELAGLGDVAVVAGATSTEEFVVIWDAAKEGAMAYRPVLDGAAVTLEVINGRVYDAETGSRWRLDGRALTGPLEGAQLEPVDEAFVAFWFSWPAFYPDLELWEAS
jgi:hypothetical protein